VFTAEQLILDLARNRILSVMRDSVLISIHCAVTGALLSERDNRRDEPVQHVVRLSDRQFATSSNYKTVSVWDSDTCECVRVLDAFDGVSFFTRFSLCFCCFYWHVIC
jgi:hypothetical protein